VAIVGKGPIKPRGTERQSHIVIGDDQRIVANAEASHRHLKRFRLNEHVRNQNVRIGKIFDHPGEDSAGNVTFQITVVVINADASTVFITRAPAHIDNSNIGVV